jgi:hypothetical protein
MPLHTDNLESTMRYALLTTRAIIVCPFHPEVMIRVGDGGAETHAYYRARSITKSDGTCWERGDLMQEIVRQLTDAADGVCPRCAQLVSSHN